VSWRSLSMGRGGVNFFIYIYAPSTAVETTQLVSGGVQWSVELLWDIETRKLYLITPFTSPQRSIAY
jgi:hypothetical protein